MIGKELKKEDIDELISIYQDFSPKQERRFSRFLLNKLGVNCSNCSFYFGHGICRKVGELPDFSICSGYDEIQVESGE